MTLLSTLENYILSLEQAVQRLQQENQLLKQSLQESKGINPKKDNKK
tara:strand:- start:509 stop:649 length:141 start_codon:yes stop_codon:yes gene_type:complete